MLKDKYSYFNNLTLLPTFIGKCKILPVLYYMVYQFSSFLLQSSIVIIIAISP